MTHACAQAWDPRLLRHELCEEIFVTDWPHTAPGRGGGDQLGRYTTATLQRREQGQEGGGGLDVGMAGDADACVSALQPLQPRRRDSSPLDGAAAEAERLSGPSDAAAAAAGARQQSPRPSGRMGLVSDDLDLTPMKRVLSHGMNYYKPDALRRRTIMRGLRVKVGGGLGGGGWGS